jgi:cytidine deaminase
VAAKEKKEKKGKVDEEKKVWSLADKEKLMSGFNYEASRKPRWKEDRSVKHIGDEGVCVATVVDDDGDEYEGAYSSSSGWHGEMAALEAFLNSNQDLDDIDVIKISSAPCGLCKAVLNNLGLMAKVRVPLGQGKKTGSNKGSKLPPKVWNLLRKKFPEDKLLEHGFSYTQEQ